MKPRISLIWEGQWQRFNPVVDLARHRLDSLGRVCRVDSVGKPAPSVARFRRLPTDPAEGAGFRLARLVPACGCRRSSVDLRACPRAGLDDEQPVVAVDESLEMIAQRLTGRVVPRERPYRLENLHCIEFCQLVVKRLVIPGVAQVVTQEIEGQGGYSYQKFE